MIRQGDLSRSAQVRVLDGYQRSWHTLWRKRPIWRVVWAGYIERFDYDMRGGSRITLIDVAGRLKYVNPNDFVNVVHMRPKEEES